MVSHLYEGIVALVDTETGERVNMAVLIALRPGHIAYTMSPIGSGQAPVTLQSERPGDGQMIDRVIREMFRLSERTALPPHAPASRPGRRQHRDPDHQAS